MSKLQTRALLTGVSALGLVAAGAISAQAGGFAVREQSAFAQGSSFAGAAAGGAPSSMYWNPATMTQQTGMVSEWDLALLFPQSSNTALAGTTAPLLALGNSGNIGDFAAVPSGYSVWQVMPNLWLGLSSNAPFGLSVSPPNRWAGYPYARKTDAKSYNFAPSVAFKLNELISFGFGVQIQYMTAKFNSGIFGFPVGNDNLLLKGDGFGFGATAGVTITPSSGTQIGLGWRSGIDQDIDGTLTLPIGLPASTPGAASTQVRLPDIFTASIRQRVAPAWTLMGTFEYTNWSRIGTSRVLQASGAPSLVGGGALLLPFNYSDGWFVSAGAEFNYSPGLTLRTGLGFEHSPISDLERTPRIPDNDRIWLSVGASYQVNNQITVDVAYSHVFVKDAPINISAASGNPWFSGTTYIGTASSSLDIVSVALKYQWYTPQKSVLITKG